MKVVSAVRQMSSRRSVSGRAGSFISNSYKLFTSAAQFSSELLRDVGKTSSLSNQLYFHSYEHEIFREALAFVEWLTDYFQLM